MTAVEFVGRSRTCPLDIRVLAGEPIDFSVPVLDDVTGAPVPLAGWVALSQVRERPASPVVLHTFAVQVETTSVRVTASGADTADWVADWPSQAAVWDLLLTAPNGAGHVLCTGQVFIYPTVTHP